jgi:preprotein translocase subunit SecF
MKLREPALQELDKRLKSRRRHEADRYASVPAYTDDMAIADDPNAVPARAGEREQTAAVRSGGNRPVPNTEATGRGRVVPPSRGPVRPSSASGRAQPSRKSKSKRGKK